MYDFYVQRITRRELLCEGQIVIFLWLVDRAQHRQGQDRKKEQPHAKDSCLGTHLGRV